MLDLMNQHRKSIGLPPLSDDGGLAGAAREKARRLSRSQVFDHTLDGETAPELRAKYGNSSPVSSEIIAWGHDEARGAFNAWMSSPIHRQMIEEPRHRYAGVGGPSGTQLDPHRGTWVVEFSAEPSKGGSVEPDDPKDPEERKDRDRERRRRRRRERRAGHHGR